MLTDPMPPASARSVLLCEDDPVHAGLVGSALKRLGWDVIGPVGRLAPAARHARETAMAAAILDVHLADGLSTSLAAMLETRGIPFAFVTAYGPGTSAALGRFSDRLVVPKPVSPDLIAAIMEHLVPPLAVAAQ